MTQPDGILLFDEADPTIPAKHKEAGNKLYNIVVHRPKSIIVELNIYRKYVPMLLDYVLDLCKIANAACRENERIHKKTNDRSHQRWTDDEDNRLIDVICKDDTISSTELSVIFGRSPGSISTRISYLVGRKRISQSVAGRFIGLIDGKKTEAEIIGVVHKDARLEVK